MPSPDFFAPTQALNKLGREAGHDFERTFMECVGEASMFALRELGRLNSALQKINDLPGKEGLWASALWLILRCLSPL